jgi:hypothetical protein
MVSLQAVKDGAQQAREGRGKEGGMFMSQVFGEGFTCDHSAPPALLIQHEPFTC